MLGAVGVAFALVLDGAWIDNKILHQVDNWLTIAAMGSDRRDQILRYLKRKGSATGPELAEMMGITRQAANKHIQLLMRDSAVVRQGNTRASVYSLPGQGAKQEAPRRRAWIYPLSGLMEDRAFDEFSRFFALESSLAPRAMAIIRYAFTEILNNAVDHSQAARCVVRGELGPLECSFEIHDPGIGIFESVRSKLGLPDEATALGEILKGKVTTMRERHSGEGIFFVSKAGDRLRIRSHRTILTFDNRARDTVVEEARLVPGTDVRFSVSRRTRRDLNAIFREYAPEEFDLQFERTRVLVRLYMQEFVSRSEARRMLSGLEKFREVILDFARVRSIGQGFADEVFRVFPGQHPATSVRAENAVPAVAAMIRHAGARGAS